MLVGTPAKERFAIWGQSDGANIDQPCEAVEQMIPPGSEPGLLKGATRLWVFDSAACSHVKATLRDETNKEVEFYCYVPH